MSGSPPSVDARAHREAWNLLPWIVNGTADETDRRRAEGHLAECADCREELAFQRLVQRGIAVDDGAPHDPAPGLQRLRARLHSADDDAAPGIASRRSRRGAGWVPALAAAVVVQAIGLGALGALLWADRSGTSSAPYRTLTDAPARRAAVWRVVPAPTLPLAGLRSLLQGLRLEIVETSGDGAVLGVAPKEGAPPRETTLQALRADPRVLLAEPVAADPPR